MYDIRTKQKIPEAGQEIIWWGCLYMDAHERWSKVESQWKSLKQAIRKGVILKGFHFQVVCLERQQDRGVRYAMRVVEQAKSLGLPRESVRVSILVADLGLEMVVDKKDEQSNENPQEA